MQKKKKLTANEGWALGRRYLASGKTRREFAKEEGVTMPMVQYWSSKVRGEEQLTVQGAVGESASAFIEVVSRKTVTDLAESGATLEMQFCRMHFDTVPTAEYVAELAVAMARRTGC